MEGMKLAVIAPRHLSCPVPTSCQGTFALSLVWSKLPILQVPAVCLNDVQRTSMDLVLLWYDDKAGFAAFYFVFRFLLVSRDYLLSTLFSNYIVSLSAIHLVCLSPHPYDIRPCCILASYPVLPPRGSKYPDLNHLWQVLASSHFR